MEFVFSIPTPPALFVFSVQSPVNFVFEIANTIINIVSPMFKEITVVSGDIDGSNKDFGLEHEATAVFKNGQLLTKASDGDFLDGDYITTGIENLTVSFKTAPFFDMDDASNIDKIQYWTNF